MPEDRVRVKRAAVLALVLYAVGAAVFFVPFLTREREVFASTPNPPPLFEVTQLSLSPGVEVCVTEVPLGPDSDVLRLRSASEVLRPGPDLDVDVSGPGYRYTGRLRPDEVHTVLDIPIQPPATPVQARVCVHNNGPPGVILVATDEPRTKSPTTTYLDRKAVDADVTLQVLERRPRSIAGRLGTVFSHASTFKPGIVSAGLLWVIASLVVIGVPLLVAWALRAGWDGDQA